MSTIQNQNTQTILIVAFIILMFLWLTSCRTTKIDHKTGNREVTWNTKHMNKIHRTVWHAGNDTIRPAGFQPRQITVKK